MTTPMILPPQFVLYIPTRSTKKDPFAGYILVNATPTPDGKAQQLSAASMVPYSESSYILKPTTGTSNGILTLLLGINVNMPLWATFQHMNQIVQPPNGGESLVVLSFSGGKLTYFLPPHLKRNIPIISSVSSEGNPKPTIITNVTSPAMPPPLLTPAGGAGDPTPISETGNKKKKTSATIAKKPLHLMTNEGDLSFHVARQLLELARIRKTECPIIAEELSEGNTAAMPCGHLFSRIAIEESFKSERNQCPACRLSGMPTYV